MKKKKLKNGFVIGFIFENGEKRAVCTCYKKECVAELVKDTAAEYCCDESEVYVWIEKCYY